MRPVRLACVAVAVTACGGGGDSGGGPGPTPQVASVVITAPSGAQTVGTCGTVNFTAQARDAQGNSLSSATINWASSDQTKLSLSGTSGTQTTGTGVGVGSSTVTASSGSINSTGVAVTVTAAGAASSADVNATTSNTFTPACVTITAGGTVTWSFASQHNVRFGSGGAPPGGDIGEMSTGSASRTFPAPGNFPYTCTLHAGMNGRVVVVQ